MASNARMQRAARRTTGMGSGTATNLALNIFRASVERNRTRIRLSEMSPPPSGTSMLSARANSNNMLVQDDANRDDAEVVTASARRTSHNVDSLTQRRSIQRSSIVSRLSMFDAAGSPVANDLVQTFINSSPGCYANDDGSSDIADRYNFYAHGRRFLVGFHLCCVDLPD